MSSKFSLTAIGLTIAVLVCSCDEQTAGEFGRTTTAKRGRFEVAIQEDGHLKALTSATITAKESGKIEWLAPEGQTVQEGDVLVRMEKKELEEDLDRYRNSRLDSTDRKREGLAGINVRRPICSAQTRPLGGRCHRQACRHRGK